MASPHQVKYAPFAPAILVPRESARSLAPMAAIQYGAWHEGEKLGLTYEPGLLSSGAFQTSVPHVEVAGHDRKKDTSGAIHTKDRQSTAQKLDAGLALAPVQ